jgi:anaerobic nitric oxide reductase transcription regulator
MTTPAAADDRHFKSLLAAVRGLVACDAAVLLRLHDDALMPVAVDGLTDEAMGRRFPVAAHPRLAQLLGSSQSLRFAADCGLPDPYDGLVAGQRELLAVHDCMGAPLRHAGKLWGLVTLDALNSHAFDAVAPQHMQAVVALLEAGIEASEALHAAHARAAHEQALARERRAGVAAPRELLGKSAAMQQLKREIDTVAASDLTVLILGETGVGKELVAQRLHMRSSRAEQALVQINCAALPEGLADSELFGHKKGAFTSAVQDRVGKFELADGGTLFLDEVGELSLPVQAKLLRVLQSGELQRPGSDKQLRVDVRVLAATNRDLRGEVAAGRFRADLYHRLSVYPLQVPPLRERGRDVLTLAGGFLEENQHRLGARNLRLTPDANAALLAHGWPGNVRELEHVLSRAALRALSEQGRGGRWIGIEPRHLALHAVGASAEPTRVEDGLIGTPGGLRAATEAFQRRWMEAAIARHEGSLARAAEEAGMDRSNFHRLARRMGLIFRSSPSAQLGDK